MERGTTWNKRNHLLHEILKEHTNLLFFFPIQTHRFVLACLIHQHHIKTISVIKSSLNYNNSENALYFKTLFSELDFSDISYRDFVSPRWDWELSLLMKTLFLLHFALCILQRILTSLQAHLEIIQFNHQFTSVQSLISVQLFATL